MRAGLCEGRAPRVVGSTPTISTIENQMNFFQRFIFKHFTCKHEWVKSIIVAHDSGNPIDMPPSSYTKCRHVCIHCGKEETWMAP